MSVKRYRNFLDYWDSRFDENEKILNSYPQLANFTFRECNRLWDHLDTDYAALEVRHNRLIEALTPSAETKAAYMGEFSFCTIEFNDEGEEFARVLDVPWTTVKKIMKAILSRATGKEKVGGRRDGLS